jgi:hypothetical protein
MNWIIALLAAWSFGIWVTQLWILRRLARLDLRIKDLEEKDAPANPDRHEDGFYMTEL